MWGGVRTCPHLTMDLGMKSRMEKVAIIGMQVGSVYIFENVSPSLPIPQGCCQKKLNYVSIQLAIPQKRSKWNTSEKQPGA